MNFQIDLNSEQASSILFALSNKTRCKLLAEIAASNSILLEDLILKTENWTKDLHLFSKNYVRYCVSILERAGLVSTTFLPPEKGAKRLKVTLLCESLSLRIRKEEAS